jgi:hypothetical protein
LAAAFSIAIPWLLIAIYDFVVLDVELIECLMLPPLQLVWIALTLSGMVLYQREAQMITLSILILLLALTFYLRTRAAH